MQRIDEVREELLKRNFKGVNCYIYNSLGISGNFKVKDVTFESKEFETDIGYAYLGDDLIIDIGVGKFAVSSSYGIEEIDEPLYKWGYRIKRTDIDNNPIDKFAIEIGVVRTDEELVELVL